MGPIVPAGTSPWPWYDLAEQSLVETILSAALADTPPKYLGAPLTCKVVLSRYPVRIEGPCLQQELRTGELVVVAWNTVDGPGTGRYIAPVSKIEAGSADLTYWEFSQAAMNGSELTVYHCGSACSLSLPEYKPHYWGLNNGAGDNNWNYYDTCLAAYRLHFRTLLDSHLEMARACADTWWTWGLDHGAFVAQNAPRALALGSQFVRALDGKPERLPAIFAQLKYLVESFGWTGISRAPFFELREAGYLQMFVAMGLIADGDTERRTQYCSWLQDWSWQWIGIQDKAGYFPELPYGFPMKGSGASPWRIGVPIRALQYSYDVLADSASSCHQPELASHLLKTIRAAVEYTYLAGYTSSNRGIFYNTHYETAQQWSEKTGTISLQLNSRVVLGTGTRFARDFSCDGTDFLGLPGTGRTAFATYRVASCINDTELVLEEPFGADKEKSDLASAKYVRVPPSPTSCGTSVAPRCWGDPAYAQPPKGDRNLARFLTAIHGWMWLHTGDPVFLARGDELFSASFGGPADGPGGKLTCLGPFCDGVETDFAGSLPACLPVLTLVCNRFANYPGGNVYVYLGKNFGQGSGLGGAANYLAYRLMAPVPPAEPPPRRRR